MYHFSSNLGVATITDIFWLQFQLFNRMLWPSLHARKTNSNKLLSSVQVTTQPFLHKCSHKCVLVFVWWIRTKKEYLKRMQSRLIYSQWKASVLSQMWSCVLYGKSSKFFLNLVILRNVPYDPGSQFLQVWLKACLSYCKQKKK